MSNVIRFPERRPTQDFGREGLDAFLEDIQVNDSFAESYGIDLPEATIAMLRDEARARRTHPSQVYNLPKDVDSRNI